MAAARSIRCRLLVDQLPAIPILPPPAIELRPGDVYAVLSDGFYEAVDAAALRAATVRIFTAAALGKEPRPEDLALVNGHLRLRRAVPAGDGFDWAWAGDEDALDRPLWAIAQSAVDLLVSDDLANVDQCAAKGCFQLFVRRSRRRKWCDMSTCGNRQKGRRYQQYLRSIDERRRRLGLRPHERLVPDSEPE